MSDYDANIVALLKRQDIKGLFRTFNLAKNWETREIVMSGFLTISKDLIKSGKQKELENTLEQISQLCKADKSGGPIRDNCLEAVGIILRSIHAEKEGKVQKSGGEYVKDQTIGSPSIATSQPLLLQGSIYQNALWAKITGIVLLVIVLLSVLFLIQEILEKRSDLTTVCLNGFLIALCMVMLFIGLVMVFSKAKLIIGKEGIAYTVNGQTTQSKWSDLSRVNFVNAAFNSGTFTFYTKTEPTAIALTLNLMFLQKRREIQQVIAENLKEFQITRDF